MTSDAQHSSISKIKQKSLKPGVFEAKNYLIMNTKKCLKSGVVMLPYMQFTKDCETLVILTNFALKLPRVLKLAPEETN